MEAELRKKLMIGAIMSAALSSMTGCGGGGGGGGSSSNVVPSEPEYVPLEPQEPPVLETSYSGNIIKANAEVFAESGYTGAGTLVAVLDSGVPFSGDEPYDVTSLSSQHYLYDDTHPDGFAEDLRYGTYTDPHGDAMAQIIGSSNKEVGIAPDTAMIHGVIADDDGYTNRASVWKGVEWAMERGADYANLSFSWGSFGHYYAEPIADQPGALLGDVTIKKIADDMVTNQFVVVHAAGNDSLDLTENYSFDNGYYADGIHTQIKNNLLIVGALNDVGDGSAWFSNYPGAEQDFQDRFVLAPGYNYVDNGGADLDTIAGTSPAAAHISGAMSLMKERWRHLTAKAFAQIILDTANDGFAGYDVTLHGQGKADFEAAFSPVGVASFDLDGDSYPIQAAALQLPAGFESVDFKAAFVDNYHRDFETTFRASSAPYRSSFSQKVQQFGTGRPKTVMNVGNGMALTFGNTRSQYETQNTPVVGAASFTDPMFTQDRQLNTLSLSTGEYRFNVASNLVEQFNRNDPLKSDLKDAVGYIAGVGYGDYRITYFASLEAADGVFYGAKQRKAQGMDFSYDGAVLSAGVRLSKEQTGGNALIQDLNVTRKAAHLGLTLIDLPEKGVRFGVTGEVSQSDMKANLELPRSIGNGELKMVRERLSGEQFNVATGLYAQSGNLTASIYSDKFDKNLFVGYTNQF